MGRGAGGDGGGRCSCTELTPHTLQSQERPLRASPSPRGGGRPPFGTGGTQLGVTLHNHTWVTLGMERMGWHSASLYALPWGGELKATCGFCL